MKKFYASVILLLLVSVPLFAGSITRTVTFTENDITFSKVNGSDVVELLGYPALINPGSPRIPRVVEPVLIPAGTRPVRVEILTEDVIDLPGVYNIIPAQPDVPLPMPGKTFTPKEIAPNAKVYNSDKLYPQQEIKVSGYGTKDGYRIAHIELYPLRYNPKEGILQFTRSITYRVTYEYSKGISTVPTEKQKEIAASAIKGFVVNPQDITSFAPSISKQGPSPLVPPGYYEYVIISESPMDTVFQRLADWKTKKGIPATVVTMTWINANYAGYDLQEKVRNFIIDAYTNWGTIYVLLGGSGDQKTGGQNIVPARRAWYTTSGVGGYADEDQIPTDLYYSDLDGNWDSDGDHTYGETGDNVDMYADVYVGRASVYTVSMAQNFLYKAFTYEKTPPTAYIRKMLLPTGILWNTYEERPMQNAIANMTPTGWFDAKMYEREGNLSRPAMIDSMNTGYGMGHWVGHGNEVGIYYGGGSTAYLTSGDADGLTNGDKEGIAISIACFTGAWDEVVGGDCFAEHLVNRVGGGLLAAMMNSRYGWGAYVGGYVPGPSERLDTTFYANIFEQNIYHLGDAHGLAKDTWVPYADQGQQYDMTRWCLYENNLFGDPEIPLWRGDAGNLAVTHKDTIPLGNQTFDVTVRDAGTNNLINGATVCIMTAQDTIYRVKITNASGVASFNIAPSLNNDTLWITCTKYENNYKPNESFSLIIDSDSPNTPVIYRLFNYEKTKDKNPTFEFRCKDPQNDQVRYCIYWDIDPDFGSPDSEITGNFPSDTKANYTLFVTLIQNATYWFKVRGTDFNGPNYSDWSTPLSFTVDTLLSNSHWFQTTAAQFDGCNLNSVIIEGDSLVIALNKTVTLLDEGFENAAFPPTDWAKFAGPSNGSSNDWARQTDQYHSGNGSAGIKYDGSYTVDRFLATKNLNLQNLVNIQIVFWSRDNWASYYKYHGILVSTTSQTTPADYTEVSSVAPTAEDSWEQRAIDLSAYDGSSSIFVAFRHNERDGTDWWVDDVRITGDTKGDSGVAESTPIAYIDFPDRDGWDKVKWTQSTVSDSIRVQLEYLSGGFWVLIPDGDLTNNSTGFFTKTQTGEVDISGLDTTTYDTLKLVSTFYKKATKASSDPSLLDWEVGTFPKATFITLTAFEATAGRGGVKVYWRTESEVDNAYWVIERAVDLKGEWGVVGTTEGQGTKPTPTDYEYMDETIDKDGEYYYRLVSIDGGGSKDVYGPIKVKVSGFVPRVYALHKVYPNPFSRRLVIGYDVPKASNISLRVYDVSGRIVKTLVNGKKAADYHSTEWDAKGDGGKLVGYGVYFLRMDASAYTKTQKLLYVR